MGKTVNITSVIPQVYFGLPGHVLVISPFRTPVHGNNKYIASLPQITQNLQSLYCVFDAETSPER